MPVEVWAPRARRVSVVPAGAVPSTAVPAGAGEQPLSPCPDRPGWFFGTVPWLRAGVDYRLRLDDGEPVTDPRARRLPDGVDGPAQAWDPAVYRWSDAGWTGRELAEHALVYELHVGTFTPEGTLDAAVGRLGHLSRLGVTHVELMPLAAFDGPRGWGYDPVGIDAVHESYGGPDALCRFVDAAHGQGLAVLLDVVQNHLGPTGSTWHRFGPLQSDAHRTPWGAGTNLDGPGSHDVRAVLVASLLQWLRDFHLDGLRLDAVHELRDDSPVPYLAQLSAAVDSLAAEVGRPLSLVAESDLNDARMVTARELGGLGMTAQWDDDVHHGLHWLLTGETQGYYADFGSAEEVAYAFERGFRHDGGWSTFRGRAHGGPVDWSVVDPWRLVVALQTHDQVGNRALGDRLGALVDEDLLACGAALLLTLPYTPLLFMGEEWGSRTPWQFFTSFDQAEVAVKVTEGRRQEFANHGWTEESVPDPQDPRTFERSRLEPPPESSPLLEWYRRLVSLRATQPDLGPAAASPDPTAGGLRCSWDDVGHGERPRWFATTRGRCTTAANLSDVTVDVPLGRPVAEVVAAWRGDASPCEGPAVRVGPRAAAVVRTTG